MARYTAMFTTLDTLMAVQLPQMELYCEIGRVVSGRSEKGAAVAASEYLFICYFRKIVIETTVPTIWFHLLMAADAAIVLGIGYWMYKKYNHRFLYYV